MAPSGGPPGGGRQPLWGGPGGGGGDYDPDDVGDDEGEDDESVASFGEQQGRVRHPRVSRRECLVSAPGGGLPDEPDPDYDDPYTWMRGLCRRRGQRGGIGHPGAQGVVDSVSTPGPGPFTSTGLGEPPSLNFTTNTLGVENSLRYMGDLMNRLLEAQRSVNQTMAAHMNATVAT